MANYPTSVDLIADPLAFAVIRGHDFELHPVEIRELFQLCSMQLFMLVELYDFLLYRQLLSCRTACI